MKLSDEQLSVLTRTLAATEYVDPLIQDMARELLASRKVVEAARVVVTTAQSSTHGDYSIVPSQAVSAVATNLTALDEATKP